MIAAIIQARMASTRLPGKVMIDIQGKPLLWHVVENVKRARLIDNIVIATTENEKDDIIVRFADNQKISCYVGNEEDVLDRFYQAANQYHADTIVRITADDPFKDPRIIDEILKYYLDHKSTLDYVSNTIKPTYPEGIDVEVFSFQALKRAWDEAEKPSEREHVTPYIWKNPGLFRTKNIEHDVDLSHLRWTLDNEADLRFTREVYLRLYTGKPILMNDILELLEREPELGLINQGTARNAGYLASIEQEKGKTDER